MGIPKLTENQAFKIICFIIILVLLRLIQCIIYKFIIKKKLQWPWTCPLSSNGIKNSTLLTLSLIIIILLLRK